MHEYASHSFLYLIRSPTLEAKIFTAMAKSTTPKNFRIAVMPAGPSSLAIKSSECRTRYTKTTLIRMAINTGHSL